MVAADGKVLGIEEIPIPSQEGLQLVRLLTNPLKDGSLTEPLKEGQLTN
ncbi:hypothetical protein [Xenorhabdus innexi]|uniref:Uncharacterized protein n=1 Tax=Xenorhabdus innexi TaxID=290109 RepID=A0A1N6MZA7_9GAMM|nr:hypothetical protein [Xenorhabdus innexi]PHM29058.1 hypothetical protein Xinn_03752 [Xenorhabdus innexi]SIP74150.1 hypothetical protein XIS1_530008 [Xenorhabdus innexi]